MISAVTLKEIEQVFTVIDRLGISREAVVIPLRPASPGKVRWLANGKIEIVVEANEPLADWLPELERMLVELQGSSLPPT